MERTGREFVRRGGEGLRRREGDTLFYPGRICHERQMENLAGESELGSMSHPQFYLSPNFTEEH